jgi:hypothetical protein
MTKTNKDFNPFPAGYEIESYPKPFWNAQQSWHYEEFLEVVYVNMTVRRDPGIKLHILIHSNAYAEQSWAKIEKWDGTQWHLLVQIAGNLMESRNGSFQERRPVNYTDKSLSPEAIATFMVDRQTLLEDAAHILF